MLLVNRVKPHTDFESVRVGSGLLKMTAIGLGKVEGAAAAHRAMNGIRTRGVPFPASHTRRVAVEPWRSPNPTSSHRPDHI